MTTYGKMAGNPVVQLKAEPQKVYVVMWDAAPNDMWIKAIFSTQDEADAFLKKTMNHWERQYYVIEEFTLGEIRGYSE